MSSVTRLKSLKLYATLSEASKKVGVRTASSTGVPEPARCCTVIGPVSVPDRMARRWRVI